MTFSKVIIVVCCDKVAMATNCSASPIAARSNAHCTLASDINRSKPVSGSHDFSAKTMDKRSAVVYRLLLGVRAASSSTSSCAAADQCTVGVQAKKSKAHA